MIYFLCPQTSHLPVRSTSEEQDENAHMAGLNSEEIKILRRVKEEESRKGGWVRIFPNADSWDTYGHLLHFPNAHNIMLHQRLYPDRNKGTSSGKTTSIATVKLSISKNKIQAPLGKHGIEVGQEKDGEKSASGLIRVKQYERKLKQLKISQLDFTTKDSATPNIFQGGSEVEDSAENGCEDSPASHKLRGVKLDKSKPHLIDVLPVKPVTKAMKSPTSSLTSSSNASVESSAVERTHPEREPQSVGEPHQSCYHYLTLSKTDLLNLFQNGYTLSTVQARTAFAMYLVRVQERLLSDWSTTILHRGTSAATDQIELVLRFLKYAAANLKQTFHSVVPSKKLPIQNRKKILAEQLGIFIGLYNKETEEMKMRNMRMRSESRAQKNSEGCKGLSERDFAEFVSVAKEDELEAVLMAYAKSNKSSTVFLGGDLSSELDTELEDKDKQQNSYHSGQALGHDPVTFGAISDSSEVKEGYFDSASMTMNNNNSRSPNANSLQAKVASRTVSQQGSAQHHHHTEQLCSETAAIYTQKLGRPLSSTSSGPFRADTLNEKAIEDAIHHLTAKLQLLKGSRSNSSNQTPQTEYLTAPHCGYHPSSTAGEASCGYTDAVDVLSADMSSTKLPVAHHVTFEKCGNSNLQLRNTTIGRMAEMHKPKQHFTLVGKSIKPITNRTQIKRRIPETESSLTTDHSSRS